MKNVVEQEVYECRYQSSVQLAYVSRTASRLGWHGIIAVLYTSIAHGEYVCAPQSSVCHISRAIIRCKQLQTKASLFATPTTATTTTNALEM